MQFIRGLPAKVFQILVAILCAYLFIADPLPLNRVVYQIAQMFVLVYYVVATSGSIIERTEQDTVDLILSKPFTRRDIILADFLSNVTSTSIMTLLLTIAITLVYGIRAHDWNTTFLTLGIVLVINFMSIYGFVILSGIVSRNVAIVTVLWVGYIFLGAVLLEGQSQLHGTVDHANVVLKTIVDGLYYALPQIYAVSRAISSLLTNRAWELQSILFTLGGGIVALLGSVYLFDRQAME
jgi:ABC-type transport system involved in multi-copper enzyme maturation permease subunit